MENRKNVITTVLLALGFLVLSLGAHAVTPAPDGGYPGGNTAEGDSALLSLTSGAYNTAVGFASLRALTAGNLNTATGADTLLVNTASGNTATGAGALLSNTTGGSNTANGALALLSNTDGNFNTAMGAGALSQGDGNDNTAVGFNALSQSGDTSTAVGSGALQFNYAGSANTAVGFRALATSHIGMFNTAIGNRALAASNSLGNTAVGSAALSNCNNSLGGNTAVGADAGSNVTTANNVICIGAPGNNVDNSCYIGNIFGGTSSGGVGVFVNSNGRLGTMTSSRRFKEDIKPLNKASEAVLLLKPVSFRYKKEVDPEGTSAVQFGLVAEDVEKVNPDLIVRDKEGKPYTVRYDAVNAMLLNEFLKEHNAFVQEQHKVEKLEARVATLVATVKEQTAQIQKVSAQLEVSKAAPQTVLNNQ
jgi:trimeric autotransporter adhesin